MGSGIMVGEGLGIATVTEWSLVCYQGWATKRQLELRTKITPGIELEVRAGE